MGRSRSRLISRDASGVTVIHGPWWLPVTGRAPFKNLSIRIFLAVVSFVTRTRPGSLPIVWYSRPYMTDYIGKLKVKQSVYHVVDEYSGYGHPSKTESGDPSTKELEMLGKADTVIVVTPTLFELKSPHNRNTHIVPNAVDYDAYANCGRTKPDDMAGIRSPIVGYSGLIAARLDLGMLQQAAIARPDWSFVFVGSTNETHCERELRSLRELSNVHMLGAKPVNEVPRYIHQFDVCIIPYVVNLRAQHASPLKLYEYAAASKPIVSTDFADARSFDGHIHFAGDVSEFLTACDSAMALDPSGQEIQDNRDIAARNTWELRIRQVSDILHSPPESRTHILYIAEFSTGGSVESLWCLVDGLDKLAFKATVLFYAMPDDAIIERFAAAGANILHLFPRGSGDGSQQDFKKHNIQAKIRKAFGPGVERIYESLKYALNYFRFQRPVYKAIRREIERVRPDLVHLNNGVGSDTPGIMAARDSGIPSVCHVRTLGKVTYLSLRAARSAGAFICISNCVRDTIVDYGIDPERCIVVPNAVDLQRFSEAETPTADIRKEFGWSNKDNVFALVGRIVFWKGQDFFIRAVAEARKLDSSVRGLIVGAGDGTEKNDAHVASLKSLIKELGLEDTVRFTGHRTDIPSIMKSADTVICASSLPEPFGRVIIESMAVGTPVIATDAGGAAEIISDGKNGLLVPIRDSDAMALAMQRITQDSVFRNAIRSAALRNIADHYTVSQHAQSISDIYRSVLGIEQA